MALIDATKFESCLEQATEAKELRAKAQKLLQEAELIEKKAVESFRQVREEMLKALQHEKEKIEEQLDILKTEYFKLARTFCDQNRAHTSTFREVMTSYIPLDHSYSRGNVYPTKTYFTCLVCGYTNDPKLRLKPQFYQKGSEDVIKKASEQTENLELKKTAQRIFEIRKQFKSLDDKLNENSKGFEEICSLFGHDVGVIDDDSEIFKCKCCGKKMGYIEYRRAQVHAKYRGGIVPSYYNNDPSII